MNGTNTILYSTKEAVATIQLNRPKSMNAFNRQMREELLKAIDTATNDDRIQVVVISGIGPGFSAGADLKEDYREYHAEVEGQIILEYKPFLMAIYNSPKIFIASIHGAAAGIGSALAMVCDLSIMAQDAYIYQAFAAIALVPDGGTSWHLLKTLGYRRALEAIIEAEKISAPKCFELGLTNRVVPTEQLSKETEQWAAKLAKGSPLAQKYTKQILQQALSLSLPEVIDLEAKLQNITVPSQDSREAISAFFEKRQPVFRGR